MTAYQYANKAQKNNAAGKTGFADTVKQAAENGSTSRTEAYKDYLKQKYGNVRYESIGRDPKSLDRVGKSMTGSDVVIAPNILEQMANDPEKAAYYERKIDDFFEATPRLKASFAARGLDYQPCGVVVHEDGSVTYIGGCADSPERVAEVNAINKAKREKEAAQRKAGMERSREAAEERKEQIEKAFDMVGPNAPQDVRDAWMEAAEEVNANGMGIRRNGMMSHISQMMVQRLNKMLKGETENADILGNTVGSAIQAARQALYDLDHPLAPAYRSIEAERARIKEREFYTAFLEKLEKL